MSSWFRILRKEKSFWVLVVVVFVTFILPLFQSIREAFLPALRFWHEWLKHSTQVTAWKSNALEVVFGSAALLAVGIFALGTGWRLSSNLSSRLAQLKAARQLRGQMRRSVKQARPKLSNHVDQQLWRELASAALLGYADKSVLEKHCHEGCPERPVLFANFQAYAKAVTRVMEHLERLPAAAPFPVVYTLLKRSIFDWYNPFPFEWSEDGSVKRTQVTHGWWEGYKDTVAELAHPPREASPAKITIMRLVAQPIMEHDDSKYAVFTSEALPLAEVQLRRQDLQSQVSTWHPLTANLPPAPQRLPKDLLSHLIGLPVNGDHKRLLPAHFRDAFHGVSDIVMPSEDEAGVYLRYLKSATNVEDLLKFDDFFLVELKNRFAFGLAYIDDEIRDTNGMWIIPPWHLQASQNRESLDLVSRFLRAWAHCAQYEWCECATLT